VVVVQRRHVELHHRGARSRSKGELSLGGLRRTRGGSLRRDLVFGTHTLLEGVGATVIYAGDCSRTLVAPEAHRWDAMVVVRYPSRSAFLQLVGDPAYQAISHLRTEALEEAVLEATIPWG
jgi:uncharacterized protein (DUF1330 family)